jgi:hypothetical protein
MKISSLSRKIKQRTGAALAISLTVLTGCAGQVAEAPFVARPDTVEHGELVGPFDGRVIDAATGRPVSGAVVFGSWGLEAGHGLVAPAGAVTASTETDSDGRYRIARLERWPASARVARFTLIIYRKGYVAYRSDRRFEDFGVRHDFAQTLNVVKLERFAGGLSHARHVRFVGGGGPLRAALGSEVVQASLELGHGPAAESATPSGPALDISGLLSEDELRAVTGYQGKLSVDRLGDLPQSPSYDSKHFRADGKAESFDAAIRLWRLPTEEAAEARYATLVKEVPRAESRDEVGDLSLRGSDGQILAAATLEREHRLVIELTCGVDQCRDAGQAVALLRRVLSRATRLGQGAKPVSKEPEPEPEPEKPEAPENPFQLRPPELHR